MAAPPARSPITVIDSGKVYRTFVHTVLPPPHDARMIARLRRASGSRHHLDLDDENICWVRGHHASDSARVLALRAAAALLRVAVDTETQTERGRTLHASFSVNYLGKL